jgi:cytochrome c
MDFTILTRRRIRAVVLTMCAATLSLLYADSVSHGKEIYTKSCSKCHDLDNNKAGPRLGKIYGSPAASVPDFQYSEALRSAKVTWNDETLDKWLAHPDAMIPDNNMAFHLDSASDRKAVIAYLKSLAGK